MSKLLFEHVLFFGRSLSEYEEMFGIDISQWKDHTVLDCPSGPSSFVVEAREKGVRAVGCDPLYINKAEEMLRTGTEDVDTFITRRQLTPDLLDSQIFHEADQYRKKRLTALNLFLQDYAQPQNNNHYFAANLPSIPCGDASFDFVISANFLFVYSDIKSGGFLPEPIFDFDFHLKAILELYRLCSKEVRIYPTKGANRDEHLYLMPLLKCLKDENIITNFKPVSYKGIAGAEQVLVLTKQQTMG